MSIKVTCACGKPLSVKDEFAGRKVKCPACQQTIDVPKPNASDEVFHEEWGKPDPAEDVFLFEKEPIHTSQRKEGTEAKHRNSVSSELRLTHASLVRAGVSCYFFGFLLNFFAACYVLIAPTLHQRDILTLFRIIRGFGYVSFLAEVVITVGLGLCLTVPRTMRRRNILFLAVLSSLLGVLISGRALWNPMFQLQVGRWLPPIMTLTTHLSFFLFVRGLGEFIGNSEIKRQATRVAVFLSLFSVSWLGMLCGHPLTPNVIAQGVTVVVLVTLAMLAVLMYTGILGFFQTLRLLSTCRAVLRNDDPPMVSHEDRDSPAIAASWLSRSDVLTLGVGGVVVGLALWGWTLLPGKPANNIVVRPHDIAPSGPAQSNAELASGDPVKPPSSAPQVMDAAQPALTLNGNTNANKGVANSSDGTESATGGQQPAAPPRQPGEPIEYQPFFLDRWQAKNQSTKLFPWEGEHVVLLTTTADLDAKTMATFLKRLDVGWKLYADLVGQSPRPFKQHNGKVTFACVPDASFTCGAGCGYMGMTGIEIAGFYRGFHGGPGDYDTVLKDQELFFDYYFYEMGRNYYLFEDRISLFSTGFPVAMRHVCMEDVKKWKDQDTSTRGWIERFEEEYSKSNVPFEQAFVPFGAKAPLRLNDIDGKPFESADLTILYASGFLKLRKDNGGNEWVKQFHKHLLGCPPSSPSDIAGAKGQLLNWVAAASLAAGKDLSPVFRDRWRFPLAPEMWLALKGVDWKKPGLTADNVFDSLPVEYLLPSVAMTRPGFLTSERRKQNLLADGSFEDGSASKWKLSTWRENKLSGTIEGGVVKEGQKAAVIRTTVTDDSHFDQTVAVKPGTRYLLSGWIKTKDVVIDKRVDQTYGRAGATLSIWGGYEHSQSVVGTTDWTYVTLIFDSRDRTEVPVLARLGYWNSIAAGEAWFDDLCLIPIGESPQQPTAQPPAATITTNKDWKGWPKDTPPPAIAPFNAEQAKQHQEAWAKHLGVPVEYTNSLGMKFVLIPPGEFMMGSTPVEIAEALKHISADDKPRGDDSIKSEGPQHKVILTQPYYLGAHEVRQQDYEAAMGVNPAIFSQNGPQLAFRPNFDTSKMPVENVSWMNAADFCARLSIKEKLKPTYLRSGSAITPLVGNGYRLPTEAEWEFACRAGTSTRVWFARDEDVSQFVWLANPAGGRPYPVGLLKPNPFGLYDIYGNVCEWVQDGWSPTAYEPFRTKPAIDPATDFGTTSERVLRGLVWPFTATGMRSSSRRAEPMTNSRHFFGFRAALSVDAVKSFLANPVKAEADPEEKQNAASNWKGWSNDTPPPAIATFSAEQAKQHQEVWARHLGVSVEYTNSIGMKFRLIPPGEFLMGSVPAEIEDAIQAITTADPKDKYWQQFPKSEGPQHKVILSQPIYFGVHEVTQSQYEKVMGQNPSFFSPMGLGKASMAGRDTTQHPVERTTWSDAAEYCAKLSQQEKRKPFYSRSGETVTRLAGTGYRLPSEAEWEFACRAGTTARHWIGDKDEELSQAGWFKVNANNLTHAVGELKANPFGLYDVHGNVWEWVEDWWSPTYYEENAASPAINPTGPSVAGNERIIRGGSWLHVASSCRAADRHAFKPTFRGFDMGFRVVLPVEAVMAALANPVQAETPPVEISGKELRRLEGHLGPVWKAAFSADGQRVLSGSGFPNGDSTMRLWDVETGREIRQFRNDGTNFVFGVALSPYGKQALSANSVGLTLWDVESGSVLRRMDFESTNKTVLTVAFSPDGKRAVSGGSDRVVRLWDLASGTQVRTLTGHLGSVMSVAFSPDGSQIVSCGLDADKTVRLWNSEIGKEIHRLEGHTAGVESVAFTPDGSRIVSSGFDGLIQWDAKSGKLIRKIAGDGTDFLEAAVFPDGRRVLSASKSGRVSIWDSETGQELQRLAEDSEWVWTVAVSPDGRHGVSAGGSSNINGKWVDGKDFAIRLWSLADSNATAKVPDSVPRPEARKANEAVLQLKTQPLPEVDLDENPITLRGHSKSIYWVEFSPDGKRLVSASSDHTVRVWDAQSGQTKLTWNALAYSGALSPDGTLLAMGTYKGVTLLDITDGRETLMLKGKDNKSYSKCEFSSDGKRLAAGNDQGELTIWDIASGQQTATWKAHESSLTELAFSPDGKRLASILSYNQMVKVWDTSTGKEILALKAHDNGVHHVVFSPDGKRFATTGNGTDAKAKVWDASTGAELLALKGNSISFTCLAFDPDGKRLATSDHDNQLILWDATTGQQALVLEGHTETVTHVAFSRDGMRLVSASDDLTLKVWDLAPSKVTVTPPATPAKNKTPPIPLQSAGSDLIALEGHTGSVESVVFTTDGKRIVSASEDQTLKVWDAATGLEMLTLNGHTSGVTSVVASSDGKLLASAGKDQLVKVWDATSGREFLTIKGGGGELKDVVFSPDGKQLAAIVAAGTVMIWDASNGKELLTLRGKDRKAAGVAFSPDGTQLASVGGEYAANEIRLWDIATGREAFRLKGHIQSSDDISTLAYSPDGKWLASGGGDQTVKIWDLATRQETLMLIGHVGHVDDVAFSPDGKSLASLSQDGLVKVWDTATWHETLNIKGARFGQVKGIAFSPDGKRLATASNEKMVKVWDLSLRPVAAKKTTRSIRTPAAPVRTHEPPVQAPVVDLAILTLKGHVQMIMGVAHSPDGKQLASASYDGTVKIWDAVTAQEVFTLKGHTGAVTSVAYSPDGKQLVTGSYDKSIKLWDTATGQEVPVLMGHAESTLSVAFSPDGKRLVSASSDQSAKVWEIEGSQELVTLRGDTQGILRVVFSPDGKQLASAGHRFKRTVQMWDSTSGQETVTLMGHRSSVHSVAFSPDGKRLASASTDGTVVIWDAITGHATLTLESLSGSGHSRSGSGRGYAHSLNTVAFSPDGKEVAASGEDQTVRVWNATTGQETLTLTGHTAGITGITFSPDGKRLVSGSSDRTVKVWDIGNLPRAVSNPPGSLSVAQSKPSTNDPQGDLKRLQGSWQVSDVAFQGGHQFPPEAIAVAKSGRCFIKDDAVIVVSDAMAANFSLVLDSSLPVKTADLISAPGARPLDSIPGIYTIDGEALQFAVSTGGPHLGRPKEVKADNSILLTLKRTHSTDLDKLEWFDHQAWDKAVEQLRLLKVWTDLGHRHQGRLHDEDRWFGLPISIAAMGIVDLPSLKSDGKIPDDVWEVVTSVSHVGIRSTSMTDAALRQLSEHRGLTGLNVSGSWTGSLNGVNELKKCPKLFSISLYQVPEAAAVVQNLATLTELRDLSVTDVPITAEMLESITKLGKLESLSLSGGEIDDDHAVQVAKLPHLKFLSLSQHKPTTKNKPKMTDKGLSALKGLTELKSLDIQGHRISPEALADFQLALPKCRVFK